MKPKSRKVLVIGLDSAEPTLVFNRWRDFVPNIRKMMDRGVWGPLRSSDPPITVPAWSSMLSSKNAGRLGLYGFRNRGDYSYEEMAYATSKMVKEPRVWDILSRAGREVAVIGVPQTYPIKPTNGIMISCFLAPDTESKYTFPDDLKSEIKNIVSDYIIDVRDFRTDNKQYLVDQVYKMTRTRFKLVKHFINTKSWDFFMVVEMGPDRIQHGFWKFCDPEHRFYKPGSKYENVIKDYYIYLDEEIGDLQRIAGKDTVVILVSDHGAQRMDGGICINQWLHDNGFLSLKKMPKKISKFTNDNVRWDKTIAWASGGYYGRLFMNVKGREPHGIVEQGDYEKIRNELVQKIEAITDDRGNQIGTKVLKPNEIYDVCNNIAPDLLIYFGNLYWRSVGSIGHPHHYTFENDTGPDDANHSPYGIFVMHDPDLKNPGRKMEGLNIMDVAPTILDRMGIEIPKDMEGKVI